MDKNELIPHLFRTEFSKITAVLCKHFGIQHIEMAEDIAGDAFLAALETWPYKGIPPNPVAWLYTVAKNKAKNQFARSHVFNTTLAPQLQQAAVVQPQEIDLSEKNITDSQLQMLFAICHPSISVEAQVALALRILCGFGIDEIADAFLSNKETISKRLVRAKEKLRTLKVAIEFPSDPEIENRLSTVLLTLYLLFSEGYYSESNNAVLREDLCLEAMRLTQMLLQHGPTDKPEVNALLALMCFHASRFEARKERGGEIVLYHEQDETLWNNELVARGAYYLNKSAQGSHLSKYHLEASIAYWHTIKEDSPEKWENILQLYNRLLQLEYTPVAALNRTYALSKANSKQEAITEAEKLKLRDNPYYHTLLGELYTGIDNKKAVRHFVAAHTLAKTLPDRQLIQKKIDALEDCQ